MNKIFFVVALAIIASGCIQIPEETCGAMKISEAKALAATGECAQANTTGSFMCNANTGTWWADLDLKKNGCAPACIINAETKEVGINWRCTGAIPPE